jgi:inhibitor of KinA
MPAIRILGCGEQAIVVEFGSEIDPAVNARVRRLARALAPAVPDRILEVVPTYRSLTIFFDPLAIGRQALQEEIAKALAGIDRADAAGETSRVITVPVCYGGEFGPDLESVARHNSLTADEVVALHTSAPLLIYMLGFTPGFPYLGGLPRRIAAPRLPVPRVKVPAGSVGIAGTQTGIYPIASPGGWQLIGRTPLRIFDPASAHPFLFATGDSVQFAAIHAEEFHAIRQQVERREYSPETRLLDHPGDLS